MSNQDEGPKLQCLGNQPARREILEGLHLLLELPQPAFDRIWTVLGPCLAEPVPKAVGKTIEDYAAEHGVDGAALARAVRSCRVIVRGAALLNLDAGALGADVARLLPGDERLTALLVAGYDAARTQVRREAIPKALLCHGRVLEGIDWRLDSVMTSNADVRYSIAELTLRYRDRRGVEHLTLQVMPEMLRELQMICERLIGPTP